MKRNVNVYRVTYLASRKRVDARFPTTQNVLASDVEAAIKLVRYHLSHAAVITDCARLVTDVEVLS